MSVPKSVYDTTTLAYCPDHAPLDPLPGVYPNYERILEHNMFVQVTSTRTRRRLAA